MNFEFLKELSDFSKLYDYCSSAEEYVYSVPTHSMKLCRSALEFCVKFIHMTALKNDTMNVSLNDLLTNQDFKDYIGDREVLNEMHYIRKVCNAAVHEEKGTEREALNCLESLLFIVGELCLTLRLIDDYPIFQVPPREGSSTGRTVSSQQSMANTAEGVAKSQTAVLRGEAASTGIGSQVVIDEKIVAKFADHMRDTKFDLSYKRDPETNRVLFIHANLREADWPVVEKDNFGKPFSAGKNIVIDGTDTIDYVLFGRDGKPLAIIEYSETKENPIQGRKKAKRVAEKIRVTYGNAPVIYITNGYIIDCIDILGYPLRRIFSFHSLEELEWMNQQSRMRGSINQVQIRDSITDRDYQKKAIQTVCDVFESKRRGSLLVMATGTGKTRVAISIVDVLMRNGWVKNVLFLADRSSLVKQAQSSFKKLMPEVSTSLFTGDSVTRDKASRLLFATYQTMYNLVNGEKREFGIKHFDLIIVDEAHRSIFSKYALLFEYFDSLLLGLTATPRYDLNRSSYSVFKLPQNEPDYSYELDEALKEHNLVGFEVLDRSTAWIMRGYKYKELTEEEIQEIEGALKASDYAAEKINRYRKSMLDKSGERMRVINRSTCREMLKDLMEDGYKLSDGTLGKTIIFAESHHQGTILVEEFKNMYPHVGEDFISLIDSQVPDSIGRIEKLRDRDSGLQIAVGVDMLDTGIDIPDILNLVFFKYTWSKIKFLQMIGRGTRLSKDIFGPGHDKTYFKIFDYYGNFDFFSGENEWSTIEGSSNNMQHKMENLPEVGAIAKEKLSIIWYIDTHPGCGLQNYRTQLVSDLIYQIRSLKNDEITVHHNIAYVNKYRVEEEWKKLDARKLQELEEKIFPLFGGDGENPNIRHFDHLVYCLEEYGLWLDERQPKKGEKKMSDNRMGSTAIVNLLDDMITRIDMSKEIPNKDKSMVRNKLYSIRHMVYGSEDFSVSKLENLRMEVRDFMSAIHSEGETFVIDLKDTLLRPEREKASAEVQISYPDRVQKYLAETKDSAIFKLRDLQKLTDEEKEQLKDTLTRKLGTEQDYNMWSNKHEILSFMRMQVGISDEAIQREFGSFFTKEFLSIEQYEFMERIIEYARLNGDIMFTDLMQVEPFKNTNIMQVFGTNAIYLKKMVNTIHNAIL